ncbi:MAG TPA: hypothetical protein VGU23_08280 [Acidobacteriaceae bacterium]|nr:hypothetical protein [Acidobacteriaceae bacterium]
MNVVLLLLAGVAWLIVKRRIARKSAKILAVLAAYLGLSAVIALLGSCHDHLQKALLSLPLLVVLVLIGLEVGRRATTGEWLSLQRTACWVLLAEFFGLVAEMLVPSLFPNQAGYRLEGKLSGLFHEPSHVAFSLFPCIAVLLVAESKRMRRYGVLGLVGLLILSRSSTLIILLIAWLVYRFVAQRNLGKAALLLLSFASILGLGAAVDFNRFVLPTMQRVTGVAASSETENISSLVYVQGWQDALYNVNQSHGLGLGINMMGCGVLPAVPARLALQVLVPVELNAEDGSFLFAKVLSETGAVGVIFYILAIWRWLKFERAISRRIRDATRLAMSIQAAIMFCFVILSFVRGAGYFSGTLLLWVCTAGVNLEKERIVAPDPTL